MIDPVKLYVAMCRKGSQILAPIIAKLNITPNQFTILNFLALIPLSTFFFSIGNYVTTLVGFIFLNMFSFFDFIDGELARLKSMATPLGRWLDTTIDMISLSFTLIGILIGVINSNCHLSFFDYYNTVIPTIVVLIVGLLALFAQLMSSLLTNELDYRFKFWSNRDKIEKKFKLHTHASKRDHLIKNILLPLSWPWNLFFQYGALIAFCVVFNLSFIILFVITVAQNIRVVLLFSTIIVASRKGEDNVLLIKFMKELNT